MQKDMCAGQMGVARTTGQAVYNSARKKLAEALINVRCLIIKGENYEICPRAGECACKQGCGFGCGKGGSDADG
ncbi:DUF134 domain-containing protein [Zhenpiania hominis]|uniref:DUF134 domain-containing protein n=1 Tax=Zhenpiania hominis TaxID=2763644 RepID=A0A923NGQ7_9FIRM|nr:DUF134 domain-containing protein [Zhenpiania hominis]MBC6678693.1 DUF134 domain-containing protein [Zhenpiania hominis]